MTSLIDLWTDMSFLSQFIILLTIANIIVAIIAVIFENGHPSASVAWVMIVFLIPVAGIILYFLLSQNIAKRKIYKLTSFEEKTISKSLENQTKEIDNGTFEFSTEAGWKWRDMIHLNQVYGKSYYTQNNSIAQITDGKRLYKLMLRDIAAARETINVMFFIIKNIQSLKM